MVVRLRREVRWGEARWGSLEGGERERVVRGRAYIGLVVLVVVGAHL